MLRIVRPFWFQAALGWILTANAADLVLTLWGLRLGAIREANPLLAPLLTTQPWLAAGLKLTAAALAVLILHLVYPFRPRLAAAGVAAGGLVLLGVLVLHALWIGLTL